MKSWLALFLVLGCTACSQEKSAKDKPATPPADAVQTSDTASGPVAADALAEVNGMPITADEFLKYIKPYPGRMKENLQGRDYVMQAMIDQILLEGEAKRRGLDRDPEYVAKVDAYRRNLLNNRLLDAANQGGFEVTEREAKEYFDAHPEEFDLLERVNIRHILVTSPAEAQDLLRRIRKGESFEKLAREHSQDNFSKNRGGELGPITRKQHLELVDAAFGIKQPGQVTGPVKTTRGFHLIQLIKRIPAEKDNFVEIRQSLINRLRARRRQEAKKQLLSSVREKAQIKVDKEALEGLEIE
jgi:peptidyl-prolyl cis-trans isomerase C